MTTVLAGDIGGTKTILVLVKFNSPFDYVILNEQTYPSQNFPDLVPMVLEFLRSSEQKDQQKFSPEKACFGIAGPVVNNTSELTNLSWSLTSDRLEKELNIPQIELINDFAAIGYGILGLKAEDTYTLQENPADSTAPIGVIGAGTGLGEGFLIPLGNGNYRVFGSEGSHVEFAPRSALEFEMMTYLRDKYHLTRVSVERVVSGQGIAGIYQFLRDKERHLESPALAAIYQAWEQEIGKGKKTVDLAAAVSQAAIAESDYLCGQAMRLFLENYGVEAGNLALKLLPYGGLYIAGGIVSKILPLMQKEYFLKGFSEKGRMTPLMKRIPVKIVLNPKVGLIGAALCAAKLGL
jgi:glucokinase